MLENVNPYAIVLGTCLLVIAFVFTLNWILDQVSDYFSPPRKEARNVKRAIAAQKNWERSLPEGEKLSVTIATFPVWPELVPGEATGYLAKKSKPEETKAWHVRGYGYAMCAGRVIAYSLDIACDDFWIMPKKVRSVRVANQMISDYLKVPEHECEKFIVIGDIDGTTMKVDHRLHYRSRGDYESFTNACVDDTPIKNNIIVIRNMLLGFHVRGQECLYIGATGRRDTVKDITIKQHQQCGLPFNDLYMRDGRNKEGDHILKLKFLEMIRTKYPDYKIVCAFEDRDSVVKMWRDNGITCFQVNYGNF